MEPMHPELREALKEAHPGLTDREIDRYEELLAARMRCDPEREAARIAELDRERRELVESAMPRYAAVAQAVKAAQAARRSPGDRPRGIGDAEEVAVGNGVAPERVLRQNAAPLGDRPLRPSDV